MFVNASSAQDVRVSKRSFLSAIRKAENKFVGYNNKHNTVTWEAQNKDSAFLKSDTIVFYNYHHNPARRATCQLATWTFGPDIQHVSAETEQTCQEPSTGTTHPDGSHYFSLNFSRQLDNLVLILTNHLSKTEHYRIMSIKRPDNDKNHAGYREITLVRLPIENK